jgi:hypothetical protein
VSNAELLVSIPLWYRPNRVIYFVEMVRTLADFPVRRLDMAVMAQTHDEVELAVLENLVRPFQGSGETFRIAPQDNLVDQFDLCWRHHSLIADAFCAPKSSYMHFLATEDDIRFGIRKFCSSRKSSLRVLCTRPNSRAGIY